MAEDERGDDRIRREAERRAEINEIGRFVKAARSERGWSLRRLAGAAGVSASLLSAVENGRIVPTVGSLFSISDALDRPAEDFFPANRRPERSPSAAQPTASHAGESSLPAPPPEVAVPSVLSQPPLRARAIPCSIATHGFLRTLLSSVALANKCRPW